MEGDRELQSEGLPVLRNEGVDGKLKKVIGGHDELSDILTELSETPRLGVAASAWAGCAGSDGKRLRASRRSTYVWST